MKSLTKGEAVNNGYEDDSVFLQNTFHPNKDNMALGRKISLPNLHTDDVMRVQGLATKRGSSLTHYDPRGSEDIRERMGSTLDGGSQSG